MFIPFWGKHVDSEACSIEEEFENRGFSDFLLYLMMNEPFTYYRSSNRCCTSIRCTNTDVNQTDHNTT